MSDSKNRPKNHDGSRLMTDLPLASRIIKAVNKSLQHSGYGKMPALGWDASSKNHIEFAKMAEDTGADAIIVHGRTRSQM
jgi:tRNA-dihydrouridine synthase